MKDDLNLPLTAGDGGAEYERLLAEVQSSAETRQIFQDTMQRAALLDEGRRTRKAVNLSQKQVAAAMGTTQSAVSDLEKGRVDMQIQTMQRYARALGRRFDFALVDPDLPVVRRGMANALFDQLSDLALGPLLTALVRRTKEELTSTVEDLSEAIPLAVPWTEAILSRLKAVVRTTDGSDSRYSFDSSMATLVGISIERERISAVLVDMDGKELRRGSSPLIDTTSGTVVATIVDAVAGLHRAAKRPLLGVGVCLAGIVTSAGEVIFAPELKCGDDWWNRVDLQADLQAQIREAVGSDRTIVVVENDANCLALYEYLRRDRAGDSIVTLLMSGTGTGAGIVVDGHLVRGAHSAAGEGGHTIVDPKGPKCRAGLTHRGCLETVASIRSVLQRLKIDADTPQQFNDGVIKANKLVGEHDVNATAAFRDAGEYHGTFLSTTIMMLDPARIALYGEPYLARSDLYASAQAFQSGLQSTLGDAVASRMDLVGETPIEWRSLTFDEGTGVRPVAAAAAAFWRFLQQPEAYTNADNADADLELIEDAHALA